MADTETARRWLATQGRPIDQGRGLLCESGQTMPLIEALSGYANSDGGFGRALEPDIRCQQSSVIATTVALQSLASCRAEPTNVLVQGAMTYLQRTYDAQAHTWANVPPDVGDAAHAPWWEPRAMNEYLLNPRAEIVGYMYRWPGYFPEALRAKLTGEVFEIVMAAPEIEMHDLLVVDRLVQSPGFPAEEFSRQIEHFYELAEAAIETDASKWMDYGLTPLTVIDSPDHPLAARLADAIKLNLQYLSDTQEENGSWQAPWTWFGHHEEVWPAAERDIRSLVTANNVCTLLRFGV